MNILKDLIVFYFIFVGVISIFFLYLILTGATSEHEREQGSTGLIDKIIKRFKGK